MRFILDLEVDANIDEGILTEEDKIHALHQLLGAGAESYCTSYKLHAVEVVEEG